MNDIRFPSAIDGEPRQLVPVTLELLYPVSKDFKRNGEVVRTESLESVTIRPPRGKDMRNINGISGEIHQSLAMIARLCDLDDFMVDEIHLADIARIGDVIEGFMQAGGSTGSTS